jgi:hypothetical protein
MKNTPKNHPDNKLIEEALQKIKDTAQFLNDSKKKAENLSKIVGIQDMVGLKVRKICEKSSLTLM